MVVCVIMVVAVVSLFEDTVCHYGCSCCNPIRRYSTAHVYEEQIKLKADSL